MGDVLAFDVARRRRFPVHERLELPRLEDLDGFLSELEEERWFARGRGELVVVRELDRLIEEALEFRPTVVQRARLRVVQGGRR